MGRNLVIIIALAALIYLVGAFILMELSVFDWLIRDRAIAATLWLWWSFVVFRYRSIT